MSESNDALPENWQAVKTEDGKTYYFNSQNNQTTWERPKAKARLPPGWHSVATPDGKRYYYAPATQVTQWALPYRDADMAVGWIRCRHDDGKEYYYSEIEGITSETKPEQKDNGWQEIRREGDRLVYFNEAKGEYREPNLSDDHIRVESGWIKYFDEDRKQPYWHNALLGITQWTKPGDDDRLAFEHLYYGLKFKAVVRILDTLNFGCLGQLDDRETGKECRSVKGTVESILGTSKKPWNGEYAIPEYKRPDTLKWVTAVKGEDTLTSYDLCQCAKQFLELRECTSYSVCEHFASETEIFEGEKWMDDGLISRCTRFVSHVQAEPVDKLLRTLWTTDQDDEYFDWLDVFMLRQCHKDFHVSQVCTLIQDVGNTVVEIDEEFTYLKRSFCIFEAWSSGDKLTLSLLNVKPHKQNELISYHPDSQKAGCRYPDDKAEIDEFIVSSGGFDKFDNELNSILKMALADARSKV